MNIGLLTLELYLPESNSLKTKRFALKSLKDRTRNKFNVSVAEIGHSNLWQRSTIVFACVGNEAKIVNQTLNGVMSVALQISSIEIIDSTLEML
jgi:uncharacterized protein YlxP (DUF503 family)